MAVNNRMHYLLRLQARDSATGASCPIDVAESLAHGLQYLFDTTVSCFVTHSTAVGHLQAAGAVLLLLLVTPPGQGGMLCH
jgi:hypothetical protein